jgi:hypothetical protein
MSTFNRNRKPRGNRASKKGTFPKSSRNQQQSMRFKELTLIRSYPRQVVMECWLPGIPTKFTTTVTTGLIAGTIAVNSNQVQSFATRFGSTFVEYRVVRARFRVRLFSSTNPGVLQFWIDDQSTATPTLAEAQERATLIESASATDNYPMLKWVNSDIGDLQYLAIGTPRTSATFKVYSNNANFGSSIVATDYLEVEPEFQFQFRGLQGV